MPLTVRLSAKAERTLNALAKRKRLSRSEIVREALAQYGAREGVEDPRGGPYAAWEGVIGIMNLGVRDGARTTGEQLTDILRGEARGRRAR